MPEPSVAQFDIPFAGVSVLRDGNKSYYGPENQDVVVNTFSSADKRLSSLFAKFGTSSEAYLDRSAPQYFQVLRDSLSPTLNDACVVIESHERPPKNFIALEPGKAQECISEFRNFLGRNQNMEAGNRRVLEGIIDDLQELVDKKKNDSPDDPEMASQITVIEDGIWDVMKARTKVLPDVFLEDEQRRERFHETAHAVTIGMKWDGVIGHIYEVCKSIIGVEGSFDQRDPNDERAQSQQEDLHLVRKVFNILRAALEAEAFIHQVFGENVISSQNNYQHSLLCERLLSVTEQFKKSGDENVLNVEVVLDAEDVALDAQKDFLEHTMGAVLLILAPELDTTKLTDSLSLKGQFGLDVESLERLILEKIQTLVESPADGEKLLLESYDKIQEVLKSMIIKFGQELVAHFVEFPESLSEMKQSDIDKLTSFQNFLASHPDLYDRAPLRITPLEVKAREVSVPFMRKLFNLARRSMSKN